MTSSTILNIPKYLIHHDACLRGDGPDVVIGVESGSVYGRTSLQSEPGMYARQVQVVKVESAPYVPTFRRVSVDRLRPAYTLSMREDLLRSTLYDWMWTGVMWTKCSEMKTMK